MTVVTNVIIIRFSLSGEGAEIQSVLKENCILKSYFRLSEAKLCTKIENSSNKKLKNSLNKNHYMLNLPQKMLL